VRRLPGLIAELGRALIALLFLLLPVPLRADAPSFTGVGDLAGGAASSAALAIAADGTVVVGESASANGTQAFRWTAGGGLSGLGFLSLADPYSSARAVSANGAVITGSSNDAGGVRRAYRWTGGAFTALTTLTCSMCDPVTEGWGVSGNGLVAVGAATARGIGSAPLHVDPVRWPGGGTGISDLGNLPAPQDAGDALGASDTGSIIAGAHTSNAGRDAWYWNGSGLIQLPRLSVGSKVTAAALAVSRDASAIVGFSTKRTITLPGGTQVAVEPQAVRWSGAGYATIQNLGILPGSSSIDSRANAVTPDGSIAVGRALDASGANRAFIWDAEHGMRDLAAVLTGEQGLVLTGWVLSEATGISSVVDGAFTVVGRGVNPQGNAEGWVAQLTPSVCRDGLDNDGDTDVDHPDDPGCASEADSSEEFDCEDALDNDGDGDVDHPDDPGCTAPSDPSEDFACSDGLDNDGDTLVDFPDDPGCANAESAAEDPACSDGLDNDGDTATDHPADAQCVSPADLSEVADCNDGLDNDADGDTDFPDDADCDAPLDASEHPECSDGIDNDGDSTADYPAEYPACLDAADAIEARQCADGVDNDGDTLVDFPADASCANPSGESENPFIAPAPGLLAVDRASRALFFVNTATGAQTLISEKALLEEPQGLVARGAEVLVADPAGLVAVAASGVQRLASPPLAAHESLQVVLDAGGLPTILEASGLSKVTGSETGLGTKSTWRAIPALPEITSWEGDSLAIEATGNFVATAIGFFGNGVMRIHGATGAVSVLDPALKVIAWRDLAVEGDGDLLAAGSVGSDAGVFRVNPSTGIATPLNTSFGWQRPTGVAVDGDGEIYVADAGACAGPSCVGGSIVHVDPVSGTANAISSGGHIAGELDIVALPEPRGASLAAGIALLATLARWRLRRYTQGA
jgi:probable HAF family extracellular repeat protein